jgi:hypothetical protein
VSTDEQLLQTLRAALDRTDPMPEAIRAAAYAAFAWRDIDAELAALIADSAETPIPAGVRTAADHRLLTFRAPGTEIEIEVAGERLRQLTGQLVPPGPASITVCWPAGSLAVEADDLGRFTADNVPPGPVSLQVRRPSAARPVSTDWVVI